MSSPAEARDRARKLLWAGDAAGAQAEYDRAIAAFPEAALLYAGRAAVTGSKEDVERALALDPKCADALLARARMSSDPRAALADVEKALEADPGHLPARYWRALWRAGFGEEPAAEADLRALLAGTEADLVATQYRAFAAMALRDAKAALPLLDRAIEGGVATPNLRRLRAEARAKLKDPRGAVEDWTKVLEATPDDVPALVERSLQSRLAGFPADAMRDLERALAVAPEHPGPLFHRAMARGGMNPGGARADLEQAAQAAVEEVEGFYYRGLSKEALGRGPAATADFERALQLAPPFHRLRPELQARTKAAAPEKALPKESVVRVAPVSVVIMALNVGIWLVQGDYSMLPEPEALVAHGALWRPLVWQGEVWRLFTAMFLHIGPIHLFWNVYAGFGWCGAVERQVGSGRFVLAYVLTGLAGSAASLLGHDVVGAGASGALFGVLGLAIFSLYHRLGNLRAFFSDPGSRSILINIGIWFLIGATVLRMDNYAHGGGLVAGLLFGWLYFKASAWSPPARAAAWGLSMTLLAGFIAAACLPR